MTFEVTIPVLNEAETLRRQILFLNNFLKNHFERRSGLRSTCSLVIADNGSTDTTLDLANDLAREYSEIRVVSTGKRGVGGALKKSWLSSSADVVGYMDLDLATDLFHFEETVEIFEKSNLDLVYATRLHKSSKVINRPVKREVTSRVFNFILKNYLGTRFSDGMCGFKFLKRNKLNLLLENGAVSDGWFFSTELLAAAEWQNLEIFELPVKWTDDVSSSKVKVLKLAKEYLGAMQVLKKQRHNISFEV